MIIALCSVLYALAALVLLWIVLIAPRGGKRTKKSGAPLLGRIYAHRGVYDNETIPENSLPAFRGAVKRKLGIELDIHRTSDGEVVVFHDNTLARMCGDDRRVEEMTLSQLKECRLLGTDETIPTLREALEVVEGRVPLIVELKGEDSDTSLCTLCMPILENYGGLYCVESFNPLLVREYAKAAPHVIRGILSTRFRRDGERRGILGWALTRLLLNFLCRPDFVAYRQDYGAYLPVRICRRLGAATFAWTVRERAEYDRARPYFDAFICENVETLLR